MRAVLVAGFTQTARVWDPVIAALPGEPETLALDVPTGLDFVETALALGSAGGRGTYVGYSMGGRLCLRLALERPDLVEKLVLVSASPGIADAGEREERRRSDEELARSIEQDGVDAFLERWLEQPLFATLDRGSAMLHERIRDSTVLTHQLRALGAGAMEPVWDQLDELEMPVRFVVGARDPKYVDIAQAASRSMPDSRVEIVEGVGHAVHLEQPRSVAKWVFP